MTRAIADPEDMRRFSADLRRFCGQLESGLSAINGSFSRLSETWRDAEHAKFATQYLEATKVLERFLQAAAEQIPLLERKASYIDQYLNRR